MSDEDMLYCGPPPIKSDTSMLDCGPLNPNRKSRLPGKVFIPRGIIKPAKERPKVIWKPFPGRNGLPSAQQLALASRSHEILFEGTRGSGKTETQLMYFRQFCNQGYGRHWRGIILDRKYKMLDDAISKSLRWYPEFGDGCKFVQGGGLKWEWPDGEALLFRHMMRPQDYQNYHGHEYTFIGWNELTKQPTAELYDMMKSTNRTSFVPELHTPRGRKTLPPIPLVIFNTTNPHGPGHVWVKKRWKIGDVPPGRRIEHTTRVFNPRIQDYENITRTLVRIFGSYKENIYLTGDYIAGLENEVDPNRRKAWLHGDWDIDVGGALEGVWSPLHQFTPRFKIPSNWKVFRSFDWGSTHPFSVGWWAKSNGEEVEVMTERGNVVIRLPRGSLIRLYEWYGTADIGTNKGLKMSARNVAKGIRDREEKLVALGWIPRTPDAGPADGQIYQVNEEESSSIASKMAEEGIEWYPADKRAGSRKTGLQMVRDGLESSIEGESAGLYFMENCNAAKETLPTLPRDEDDLDDVDTTAEDHVYDDVRYAVLDNAPDFVRTLRVLQPT